MSAMSTPTGPPALDHFVHLISSPSSLEESLQLYTSLGFIVQRGGTHADQLTANCLVTLADGVYIELIAFVDPEEGCKKTGESKEKYVERQRKHWWYGREMGWIDVCLLGGATDGRTQAINEKAGPQGPIAFDPSMDGGRTTMAGKDIKWKVTHPKSPEYRRGALPFWCEDVTPRDGRVVLEAGPHPNGVTGIAGLTLLFDEKDFEKRVEAWAIIVGETSTPDASTGVVELSLATPYGGPTSRVPLILKRAQDPEERKWLSKYGEGVYEVGVNGAAGQLPGTAPPDGVERTTLDKGYGRVRFHPVVGGK